MSGGGHPHLRLPFPEATRLGRLVRAILLALACPAMHRRTGGRPIDRTDSSTNANPPRNQQADDLVRDVQAAGLPPPPLRSLGRASLRRLLFPWAGAEGEEEQRQQWEAARAALWEAGQRRQLDGGKRAL